LRRGGSRRGLWRGSGSRFGVRVVLVVGVSVPVIGRRRRLLRLGSRLGRRSRSRLLSSRSWGGLLSRRRLSDDDGGFSSVVSGRVLRSTGVVALSAEVSERVVDGSPVAILEERKKNNRKDQHPSWNRTERVEDGKDSHSG
jgi:hypothetical protein